MSSVFLPDNRSLVAEDSSGNKYIAIKMEVREKLSELFTATATVLVDRHSSSESDLMNKPLTISYRPGYEAQRDTRFIINGYVNELWKYSKENGETLWEIELGPWLFELGLRKNSRIFQNMDFREIIDQICMEYDFDTSIRFVDCDDAEPRIFCVQYQETDLEFISRLLSEEGKLYYFTHSDDSHTMVVGSNNQAFTEFKGEPVEYGEEASDKIKSLRRWTPVYHPHYGGEAVATGYNREQAAVIRSSSVRSDISSGITPSSGTTLWDSRIGHPSLADQTALNFVNQLSSYCANCTSSQPQLRSGTKFEIRCHPDSDQQGEYYIDQITHQFHCAVTEQSENRQKEYSNAFTCINIDYPFVPPVLSKPRIYGIQTALVSGPDSQEVYHNEQGDIKVRFHWDTSETTEGDQCSCWIPVAQSLAGTDFGASVLPRVGQEVVVCFIDGDPDQPVVTGSLFNGLHKRPYDEGHFTGFKTLSMPDGTEGHEVRLNDTKDQEEFYIRSQKDMLLEVVNDMVSTVVGNQTMNTEKNLAFSSGADLTIESKANASYSSTSDTMVKGQKITIEGSSGITLSSGNSEINIGPSGITIKATRVTIESDVMTKINGKMVNIKGELAALSGEMVDITGKMVTSSGDACVSLNSDGVLIINGKLTMVN
ncbi:type VI secretion system Vgr family protein [Endozoicomonas atrinae]|uniref:type VI secretion system Vgr family protein n=1 Tax=Endozoicomonas atrinae TaxID=1333660 RepID=UPI000826E1A4|nr:type VI secretion system tip protein TssI/VgrG [Endozoicomonas atrinae]